jgi:hypothetical protein
MHLSATDASKSAAASNLDDSTDGADTPITDEQQLTRLRRAILESVQLLDKHAKGMVNAIHSLGRNLIDAKKRVPYGEWETWVQANTPISQRSAQLYMKLATWLDGLPYEEAQRVALLSLNGAVKVMTAESPAELSLGSSPVDQESPPANDVGVPDVADLHKRALETFSTTSAELRCAFDEMSSGHELSPSRLCDLKRSLGRSLEAIREVQRFSRHEKRRPAAA